MINSVLYIMDFEINIINVLDMLIMIDIYEYINI